MPTPELLRPFWRSPKALAAALPDRNVSAEIRRAMIESCPADNRTPTIKSELDNAFGHLLKDIRVHDLGSCWYWLVMLGLSFIFLLIELGLVVLFASTPTLVHFQNAILVCLAVLILLLGMYASVLIYVGQGKSLPTVLAAVPPGTFHAVPVIWVSVFTVGLNYYAVSETGFSESPFLHALLAAALVVLSLPRENSKAVIVLAFMALTAGMVGAWPGRPPASHQVLQDWGDRSLAQWIVVVTFTYAGLSSVILRSIANHPVPGKR